MIMESPSQRSRMTVLLVPVFDIYKCVVCYDEKYVSRRTYKQKLCIESFPYPLFSMSSLCSLVNAVMSVSTISTIMRVHACSFLKPVCVREKKVHEKGEDIEGESSKTKF